VQTVREELVSALLAVDGIVAAEVVPLEGGPGTLRLELAPGSDEVAVAGAVNRLLRHRFGLAVDAERVQVLDGVARERAADRSADRVIDVRRPPVTAAEPVPAQWPGRDAEPAEPRRGGRLSVQRVQLVSAGPVATVTVTLARGATTYTGQAEGATSTVAMHRSVASATLRAVGQGVGGAARFAVEHVELTRLGDELTAVVLVELSTDRGSQLLTGASVVGEDARQAVVRAVLSAVNRRLAAFPQAVPPQTGPPHTVLPGRTARTEARTALVEEN
jgi:hypothetical protein